MMEDNKSVFCRFCVKPEHFSVIDLEMDNQNYENVLKQLCKLSLKIDFTSHLPKTICTECFDLLAKANTFIERVQQSQIILNQIFLKVDFEPHIKVEFVTNDCEQCVDYFEPNTADIDIKTLKCEIADVENDVEWKEAFDNIPIVKTQDNENVAESKVTFENIPIENACEESKDTCYNIPIERSQQCTSESDTGSDQGFEIVSDEDSQDNENSWDLYDWTCKFCMKKLKNIGDLRNHSKEVHGECNAFYCVDCGRSYAKFNDFISHVCGHRIHFKKSCPYCDILVPKNMHIKKHTSIHIMPPNAVCISCGEVYKNQEELAIHQEQYNALTLRKLEEYKLKCPICLKQFKTTAGCWSHKQTHDLNRKRSYICDVCGKGYYFKNALAEHVKRHNETKPHECKVCSKSFVNIHALRSHFSIHTGMKPFTCEQCGRNFRLKNQLKRHSIIHTDQMPFKCDVCGKGFRFKSSLNIHERQHTGVKPYSCKDCAKVFTNGSNYGKHMKRKHKMKVMKKFVKIIKNNTEQEENYILASFSSKNEKQKILSS